MSHRDTGAAVRRARGDWPIIAALLVLSAIPFIAGIARLIGLAGGAAVTPANARFFAAPLPVVLHIIGASLFSVLGAFQFAPGLRRRRPGWHRAIGRALAPSGVAAALSGLWMTVFYPLPPELQGPLLYVVRLLVGPAMALAIGLSIRAILRRDIARHRAWMIRAYALGQGAGTQALIMLPLALITGSDVRDLPRDLLMTAAWLINLAVAEWAIRRPARRRGGRESSAETPPVRAPSKA